MYKINFIMLYHGNTTAEIIYNRVDSEKENMGLTSWKGAPNSKIHKYDVIVAKNYLSENEIAQQVCTKIEKLKYEKNLVKEEIVKISYF